MMNSARIARITARALLSTLIASPLVTSYGLAFAESSRAKTYDLTYALELNDSEKPVTASLTVRQSERNLRVLKFRAAPDRYSDFKSGTGLERNGDQYVWTLPKRGARLQWKARVTHQRRDDGFDARLTENWALFRGEDVFPAMASISIKGAESVASLDLVTPKKWSVQTPFIEESGVFRIDNPARRFDRPTGWILAGKIGVRIDRIANTRVTAAAPLGENVRRQDYLALINWTLPKLRLVLGSFPERLLIVSAGDPFWRGGLSGPASLYIHASRPLISENGTSTLLHELFHVGLGRRAKKNQDWIIEGLAEYYSVELLRRSGTTTESRYQKSLKSLAAWANEAGKLKSANSSGAVTARAVVLFVAVDAEARKLTKNSKNLDDIVRHIAGNDEPLGLAELGRAFERVTGTKSKTLATMAVR